MRILIYGAGAVGGYLGAHLALARHDVTLLGRERLANAVNSQGLLLKSADGKETTIKQIRVATSLDQVFTEGAFDWIAFTMKAYDTIQAIFDLGPHLTTPTPIISFQNGIGNEESLRSVFGEESIAAGTLLTAVSLADERTIIEEKARGVAIASDTPAATRIQEAFKSTSLRVEILPDSAELKWSKLLINMMANATSAILDMPPREALKNRAVFRIEVEALREALAIMELQKIKVVNLPSTPVKLLAWGLRWLPMPILYPILYRQIAGGRGDKLPSLQLALRSRRRETEAAWLNGAVAAAASGIKRFTPINHSLALLVTDIASGRSPWDMYRHKPENFLAAMRIAEGMPRE
jgi:2-dehydropantoate 2-reductase